MGKENTTKVTVYRKVTLPKCLNEELKGLNLTNNLLNKCYHLLYILGVNPFRDRYAMYEWQSLSNTYLTKLFTAKYTKVLQVLVGYGFVDCDGVFYAGKAFFYRVNPNYTTIDDDFETVTFKYKSKVPLERHRKDKEYKDQFVEYVNSLDIPYPKLYHKINEIVTGVSLEKYLTNENIPWKESRKVLFVDQYGEHYTKRLNREDALRYADAEGKELILEKNTVKCMFKDDFISAKSHFIELSYKNAVESLKEEKTLYANRNTTNNRLDTNFTTLPKPLLEIIYKENEFIELDQKNSQPALLAYKLDKDGLQGEDIRLYKELTYEGKFYEHFTEQFGVERNLVKEMMFEVLFSGEKCNSYNKRMFKNEFPTVWKYIVDFKQKKGKDNFSIMLQQLESSIFIDKIYIPLTQKGFTVFTKHDSVSIRKVDYEVVYKHIKKTYENIGFKGTISIETYKKVG